MSLTHKCPNCQVVGECIFLKDKDEGKVYTCRGCGFEWIIRSGEIVAIG